MSVEIFEGDCLEILKTFPQNHFDSIVTDPPYGLALLGARWDYDVPSVAIWEACLRVLKPGGYIVSFSSTRTYHRMVVNLEDAGFEIRDMISWVYSSGFPKTMDLGNAVAKLFPAEADRFDGFGTALKPAVEPICLARKPFVGSLTRNCVEWGTGGLNINACRIPGETPSIARRASANRSGVTPGKPGVYGHTISDRTTAERYVALRAGETMGRFPANLIHDGSLDVAESFPLSGKGNAARFFYAAKAGPLDRAGSTHPTVKPVELMRYLNRLITPPGGTVLDPFAGSGTTGIAALAEGMGCTLIERDPEYHTQLQKRFSRQCDFINGFFPLP